MSSLPSSLWATFLSTNQSLNSFETSGETSWAIFVLDLCQLTYLNFMNQSANPGHAITKYNNISKYVIINRITLTVLFVLNLAKCSCGIAFRGVRIAVANARTLLTVAVNQLIFRNAWCILRNSTTSVLSYRIWNHVTTIASRTKIK